MSIQKEPHIVSLEKDQQGIESMEHGEDEIFKCRFKALTVTLFFINFDESL